MKVDSPLLPLDRMKNPQRDYNEAVALALHREKSMLPWDRERTTGYNKVYTSLGLRYALFRLAFHQAFCMVKGNG